MMIVARSAVVPVPVLACFGGGQGKLVSLDLVYSGNVPKGRR